MSTLYFGTASPAADAVSAVGTFWGTLDNLMYNQVDWATVAEVEEIGVGGELLGLESTTPETGTGSLAGDPLPWSTQGLIRWRTGAIIAGRELRGRTFVPGAMEAASDGNPTATFQANMQSAADALITDVNSELVIWSRTHGETRLVAVAGVWNQWSVQRSRRD
jgi:hypothetical protein